MINQCIKIMMNFHTDEIMVNMASNSTHGSITQKIFSGIYLKNYEMACHL